MRGRFLEIAAIVLLLSATSRLAAIDFYASPAGTTGTGSGTGTITNPWSLQTALSQPVAVQPGDTIWLRGGTYTENFTSYLTGTARAPIMVRQYPGERVTLDGNVISSQSGSNAPVLTVNGNGGYTWYRGFEVTNSSPVRTDTIPCTYCRGDGIDVFAPGTKIINVVVRDTGQGIGFWTPAMNAELYGNLIYYNGWEGPDRGHGHGVYTQNFQGTKLLRENLGFGQYGFGIHAYTEGGQLDNFVFEGNAFFLNGGLSRVSGFSTDILLGANGSPATSCTSSEKVAHKPVLKENFTFQPPDGGTAINLGYSKGTCDATVIGNHAVGRDAFSLINPFGNVNISDNTFLGSISGISPSSFPKNAYLSSRPAGIEVFVRPNAYETGRGHVLVYNWDRAPSVDVDVSGILVAGVPFEIRSARNFLGPPLASGVYSGAKVRLPLTGLPVAVPAGASAPPDWPEDFQAFVVLPPDGTFVATRVIPVIVDTVGQKGAHFSTEITLANRGVTPASMSLRYVASPKFGGLSGTVTDTLPPGVQLVIPDAISYLRSRGLPLGSESQGGSLRVTFSGLSSPEASYAAARITSPSGPGRAGTAFASVRPEDGFDSRAMVFGLRESDRERSNLALVNLATSGSITLGLTAFSGLADGRTAALTPVTLGAGEWIQVGSPLAAANFDNGFIAVERIAGTGRFFTYGVVNDNVTNDGAFIPPVQDATPPEGQILPVIVESGTFDSDLVLTNPGSQPVTATLSYVESLASPAGSVPFRIDIALGGFEQRLIPSAIEFLRKQGLNIEPRGGAGHAGAVGVQFSRDGNPARGYAGALTASPAPQGGRYGVFYNGVPVSHAAAGDAWVFGLQQNDLSRSNLAIASAGDAGEPVTCRLEVYDGDSGRLAGQVGPFVVPPRGWLQFPHVLEGFGVSNGYVRMVGTTGADHLVVYGVVNDGGTPSSGRTNDGSFILSPTN
jgi:hypothetical protein